MGVGSILSLTSALEGGCGPVSVVGVATCYELDGPGIESLPISVAERSKARFCGRSPAGIAGSNNARAWIFLVLCSK